MAELNPHYSLLKGQYLFPEIAKKIKDFSCLNPHAKPIINLGIGDISLPLSSFIIQAMKAALDDQLSEKTLQGYGQEGGHEKLRKAIISHEYPNSGFSLEEIFISDGSKPDTANILEIFSDQNKVAIADPCYPVYLESATVKGLSVENGKLHLLPCLKENNCLPVAPSEKLDIIYLCSPNNPTGTAFSKAQLSAWVQYAKAHHAIILYDTAYACFIQDPEIPKSIYEIEGAKNVAIEFRSFSKSLGFTGLRLGYTVVPNELKALSKGEWHSVNKLWARRQSMKFGGASYPIQMGALAAYTPEGQKQVQKNIQLYLKSAAILKQGLEQMGFEVFGALNSPFVWLETPSGLSSWEFFDYLLTNCQIVGVPGSGFGPSGEGYFRLSAFAHPDNIAIAISRLKTLNLKGARA